MGLTKRFGLIGLSLRLSSIRVSGLSLRGDGDVPTSWPTNWDDAIQQYISMAEEETTTRQVNCTRKPSFCQSPLNCDVDPPAAYEQILWADPSAGIATPDGHANLRSWCVAHKVLGDATSDYVQRVFVERDLTAAAQIRYDLMVQEGAELYYGWYCSQEGHCENKNVTLNTTVEEAEHMCDAHYGQEVWTQVTFSTEKSEEWDTKKTGRLACAMGNYHADVIFCREKVCNDPDVKQQVDDKIKEVELMRSMTEEQKHEYEKKKHEEEAKREKEEEEAKMAAKAKEEAEQQKKPMTKEQIIEVLQARGAVQAQIDRQNSMANLGALTEGFEMR